MPECRRRIIVLFSLIFIIPTASSSESSELSELVEERSTYKRCTGTLSLHASSSDTKTERTPNFDNGGMDAGEECVYVIDSSSTQNGVQLVFDGISTDVSEYCTSGRVQVHQSNRFSAVGLPIATICGGQSGPSPDLSCVPASVITNERYVMVKIRAANATRVQFSYSQSQDTSNSVNCDECHEGYRCYETSEEPRATTPRIDINRPELGVGGHPFYPRSNPDVLVDNVGCSSGRPIPAAGRFKTKTSQQFSTDDVCVYRLDSRTRRKNIRVDFSVLSTAYSFDCHSSIVRVYESNSRWEQGAVLGSVCGNTSSCASTTSIVSPSRYVLVKIVAGTTGDMVSFQYRKSNSRDTQGLKCALEGCSYSLACFGSGEAPTPPPVTTTTTPAPTTTTTPAPTTTTPPPRYLAAFEGGCGVRPSSNVVGGSEAPSNSWRWAVVLYQNDGGAISYRCGGTIIDESYVLTAAHCVDNTSVTYSIAAGVHALDSVSIPNDLVQVSTVILHPEYDAEQVSDNIALLHLAGNLTFSATVGAACLTEDEAPRGTDCVITGWGRTSTETRSGSNSLQQGMGMQIMSNSACIKKYTDGGEEMYIDDGMLCAAGDGVDACFGDGGSQLVCLDSESGSYMLHGIPIKGVGCAQEQFPGIYTRVAEYLDWIALTTDTDIPLPIPLTDAEVVALPDTRRCILRTYRAGGRFKLRKTPVYTLGMREDDVCVYHFVSVKANKQLVIEITVLESEQTLCYEDLVRVYESDAQKGYGEIVGTVCGSSSGCGVPPTFYVDSRYALVKVVARYAGMKVQIKYKFADVEESDLICDTSEACEDLICIEGGVTTTTTPITTPTTASTTPTTTTTTSSSDTSSTTTTIRPATTSATASTTAGTTVTTASTTSTIGTTETTTPTTTIDPNSLDAFQATCGIRIMPVLNVPVGGTTDEESGRMSSRILNPAPSNTLNSVPSRMLSDEPELTFDTDSGRIVNGVESISGSWPWMMGVLEQASGSSTLSYRCGGVLVDAEWVLTTAHCVDNVGSAYFSAYGVHAWSDVTFPDVISVDHVILHEGYSSTTLANSVALLHLSTPVPASGNKAVCLTDDEAPVGASCTITGWGYTAENAGGISNVLLEGTVQVWTNTDCLDSYSDNGYPSYYIDDGMMCATGNDVDSCSGDGGGPLVCESNGAYILHGLTLKGVGCARDGLPGVYIRTSAYKDWIEANARPESLTTTTTTTVQPGPTNPGGLTCGIRKVLLLVPVPLIIGGVTATPYSWPWQVLLRRNGGFICGGSIVSPNYVITAAHCTQQAASYSVQIGAHHIRSSGTIVQVAQVINHQGYQSNTFVNDIALLRLSQSLSYSDSVQPVCLRTADAPVGTTCIVTGWGTTNPTSTNIPTFLQEAAVNIWSNSQCGVGYSTIIPNSMVCAGLLQGGRDSCSGDSGGPLVCQDGGHYFLQGVVSWGRSPCAQASTPGVYTRTSQFLSWLANNSGGEVTWS